MGLGARLIETELIRVQADMEAKKDELPFRERIGQLVAV